MPSKLTMMVGGARTGAGVGGTGAGGPCLPTLARPTRYASTIAMTMSAISKPQRIRRLRLLARPALAERGTTASASPLPPAPAPAGAPASNGGEYADSLTAPSPLSMRSRSCWLCLCGMSTCWYDDMGTATDERGRATTSQHAARSKHALHCSAQACSAAQHCTWCATVTARRASEWRGEQWSRLRRPQRPR